MVEWEGTGIVESWTTTFDRDGKPHRAFLAVRTPEDARAMAVVDDPDAAAATLDAEITGASVLVRRDGRATLSSGA